MISKAIITSDLTSKLIKGAVIAGSTYMLYYFTKKAIENYRERSTSSLADDSVEVRQAMSLRSAMNPSGVSWLMWPDGSNKVAINRISAEIINFDGVIKAYRNLYQSELLRDLQSELTTSEFNSFLQKISNNKINQATGNGTSTSSSGTYTKPLNMVVAKQAVYVRTSPDASNHGSWYELVSANNIFKTAQAGEFIGYSTGKQHYDSINNVKFIEVAYRNASTGESKILWVSSSSTYVEQFTSVSAMEAKYPKTIGVTKIYQAINGLGLLSFPGNRAISRCATGLYDRNFKPSGQIKGNILIGYPIMNLSGKGMNYTLVKTLQGTERWVRSNHIITL